MPRKRGFFDERDAVEILRDAFFGIPKQTRKPRIQLASAAIPIPTPLPLSPDLEKVKQSNQARIAELKKIAKDSKLSPTDEKELHARIAADVSQYNIPEIKKVLETSRELGTEIPQGYNEATAFIRKELIKLKTTEAPPPAPLPQPKKIPPPPPVPAPKPKVSIPLKSESPILKPESLPSIDALEEQFKQAEQKIAQEQAKPVTVPTKIPFAPPLPKEGTTPTKPKLLTPKQTEELLSAANTKSIITPEELAKALEKRKSVKAVEKQPIPSAKEPEKFQQIEKKAPPAPEPVPPSFAEEHAKRFRVTAKRNDALWNLIEDRLGSSNAMGANFARMFNALPRSKRIQVIDAVEDFIQKNKDSFKIPAVLQPGDTIDLGLILDDEETMLNLIINAQNKEKALDAIITRMNADIINASHANEGKTPVEIEIDKIIFGSDLPPLEKIIPEEVISTSRAIVPALPGTEAKKQDIMLYHGEDRWRRFLGFSAEHYNSIRNVKIKHLLDLVPSREKAEVSWGGAVRQDLLDVPRGQFESLVRLSEFIHSYSAGNGKGIREMTIRQFLGGISKDQT